MVDLEKGPGKVSMHQIEKYSWRLGSATSVQHFSFQIFLKTLKDANEALLAGEVNLYVKKHTGRIYD